MDIPLFCGSRDGLWRYIVPGQQHHFTERGVRSMSVVDSEAIAEYDSLVTDSTLLALVTDWEAFLSFAEGGGPMKKLQQATRTGRPAGDGSFVTTVERLAAGT